MDKAKVYLFTSPTCPNCPPAKRFIQEFQKEREDFDVIELSTVTKEGQKKARTFNVMSVPTFIIKGPGYPQAIGLVGLQSEKAMHKYLDLSFGKEVIEEKAPSLRDRLREGFRIGKLRIKV